MFGTQRIQREPLTPGAQAILDRWLREFEDEGRRGRLGLAYRNDLTTVQLVIILDLYHELPVREDWQAEQAGRFNSGVVG